MLTVSVTTTMMTTTRINRSLSHTLTFPLYYIRAAYCPPH